MQRFVEIAADCEMVEVGGVRAEVVQLSDHVASTWFGRRSELSRVALCRIWLFQWFWWNSVVVCGGSVE